jgi:hypothetical protein
MQRCVILLALLGAAACGSKDDSTSDQAGATPTTEAPPPPAPATGQPASAPATPPAEDSGTVVYAGATSELGADDFGICETVNPAFKGDFNIVATLADGTKLKLMGNVDDHSADHQGLILGDLPDEEKARDLKVELDGRTLSGSARTEAGPIEFRFEC